MKFRHQFFAIALLGSLANEPVLVAFTLVGDRPAALAQTQAGQELSGIAGEVNQIAQQITVLINSQKNGNGSGAIIAKQGNTYYVLTAAHVVKNPDDYNIVAPDGQQYQIDNRKIALLSGVDLAVVQFTSERTYQVATLANYNLEILERPVIFLFGFPGVASGVKEPPEGRLTVGLLRDPESGATVTKDIYSLTPTSGYELVYTNPSQRGMSGGALLDTQGRLIGINAASEGEILVSDAGQVSEANLGYSLGVPVRTFLSLAERVQVQPDWLKVETDKAPSLGESEAEQVFDSLYPSSAPSEDATAFDWLNWGNLLWRRGGRTEEAVAALDRAIVLKPDFYQAYYAKGQALSAMGKYEKAVVAFAKATQINPQFYPAWRERADNLVRVKKYSEALTDIDKAIAIESEDWVLYFWRSRILMNLYRYPEAVRAADKAIALNPENSISYMMRGGYYNLMGQSDKAIADTNKVLQLNPSNYHAYVIRGSAYQSVKDYQKAIADYTKYLEFDLQPDLAASAYSDRASVYSELKQYDKAFADYEKAISLDSNNSLLYLRRSLTYLQLKQYDKALVDLTKAIEIEPKNLLAYFNIGWLYLQTGDYEKALTNAQKALTINPKYEYGYLLRGSVRLEQKDYQNALVEYEQALAINKNFWQAYSGIGAVYYEMGDKKVAIEQWQKALSLEPNNANVKMTIATALYMNGESEKGLQMASEALKVERRLSDENYINKNFLGENLRADLQKILNHSRIQAILRQ